MSSELHRVTSGQANIVVVVLMLERRSLNHGVRGKGGGGSKRLAHRFRHYINTF